MSKVSKRNWIDVDEFLPFTTDNVLHVMYEDGSEDVARFVDGDFYVMSDGGEIKNIEYWRPQVTPVTEPQKEDEK